MTHSNSVSPGFKELPAAQEMSGMQLLSHYKRPRGPLIRRRGTQGGRWHQGHGFLLWSWNLLGIESFDGSKMSLCLGDPACLKQACPGPRVPGPVTFLGHTCVQRTLVNASLLAWLVHVEPELFGRLGRGRQPILQVERAQIVSWTECWQADLCRCEKEDAD